MGNFSPPPPPPPPRNPTDHIFGSAALRARRHTQFDIAAHRAAEQHLLDAIDAAVHAAPLAAILPHPPPHSPQESIPMAPLEPAPLPPPMTAGQLTAAAAPTTGAVVGSAVGAFVAAKLGLTQPIEVAAVVSVVAGIITAAFHWLGSKIGDPSLG
jgi:hypothetical protein